MSQEPREGPALPSAAAVAAALLLAFGVCTAGVLAYINDRYPDLMPLIFPKRYGIEVRRQLPPVLPPDEKPAAETGSSTARAAALFSEARSDAAQSSAQFQAEFLRLHPEGRSRLGRSDPAVLLLPPGAAIDEDTIAPGPGLAGTAARKVRPGEGPIRYGAAARGQIMSRGAGPVLNATRTNARRALGAGSKASSGASSGAASGVSGSGAAGAGPGFSAARPAAGGASAKDAGKPEAGRAADPAAAKRKSAEAEAGPKQAAKPSEKDAPAAPGGPGGAPHGPSGPPPPPDPKALMDQIMGASRQAVDDAASVFNEVRRQGGAVSQQAVQQGREKIDAAAKDAPKPPPPPQP